MQTSMEKRGCSFVLNGVKTHINDTAEAYVTLLLTKADKGLTVFILEKDTRGLLSPKSWIQLALGPLRCMNLVLKM
jgi:alkylation response protein AidB-like acyl-CoA dehydrogenase